MSTRAVALMSGGLDSVLAIKLLQDQGIDVLALNFVSAFFTCAGNQKRHIPTVTAREEGFEIRVVKLGMDYMRLLENPPHGRGREMNPCVDCHRFMLQKAKKIMTEIGAAFVLTGEVLGQRPLSQHLQALRLIEKEAGLSGRLLRPLSAQLLAPTIPEEEGLVDRSRLLAIQGRSRKNQFALAEKYKLRTFSAPAGGCLLTDPVISRRLQDLFAELPDYDLIDVRLLSLGRHFRLHPQIKAIVGRNLEENERLGRLADRHQQLELRDHNGPLMLVRGEPKEQDFDTLGRLLLFYAKKVTAKEVVVRRIQAGRIDEFTVGRPLDNQQVEDMRI
jgi:tRNA-uridine 2-sulfurtransferase